MEVEIEFAAIKAQLIALGKWEEFAGMFDDAYRAAREQSGRRVRGGGRGDRVEARVDIREEIFGDSLGSVGQSARRLPRGRRGLKPAADRKGDQMPMSPPAREARIETRGCSTTPTGRRVASRAGGAD